MKQRLKQNFLPFDYIDSLHKGYLSLQQGAYSLDEYTNLFREYIVRCSCNLQANDGLIVNKYTEGLRPDIQQRISMFDFNDIKEVYCKARKAQHEIQLRRRERYRAGEFSN